MDNFISRLQDEHDELEDKLGKLRTFLRGSKISVVGEVQLGLLQTQETAMATYLYVLEKRMKDLRG